MNKLEKENMDCEKLLDILKNYQNDYKLAIIMKSFMLVGCDSGLSYRQLGDLFLYNILATQERQKKSMEKTNVL